jgi:hypothetical protein
MHGGVKDMDGKSGLKQGSADFEAASEPMRASMLWRDAMRVIGGRIALHAPSPLARGLSWEDFERASRDDYDTCEREIVDDLTYFWVAEGLADPSAAALLFDGMSWCFGNDMEYSESIEEWYPGMGALICAWPTDAISERGRGAGEPIGSCEELVDFEILGEGRHRTGTGAKSGRDAFAAGWAAMKALGCHFDMDVQRKLEKKVKRGKNALISQKIVALIPELFAQEESKQIESSAKAGSAPVKMRAGL